MFVLLYVYTKPVHQMPSCGPWNLGSVVALRSRPSAPMIHLSELARAGKHLQATAEPLDEVVRRSLLVS